MWNMNFHRRSIWWILHCVNNTLNELQIKWSWENYQTRPWDPVNGHRGSLLLGQSQGTIGLRGNTLGTELLTFKGSHLCTLVSVQNNDFLRALKMAILNTNHRSPQLGKYTCYNHFWLINGTFKFCKRFEVPTPFTLFKELM